MPANHMDSATRRKLWNCYREMLDEQHRLQALIKEGGQ